MSAFARRIAPKIILVLCGSAAAVSAQIPGGVSPGLVDRIAETVARCPTFSWQEVPGVVGYELVAYALLEGVEPAAVTSAELGPEEEVLYARVPGGATNWTPALDRCLAPGGSYVWFVRFFALSAVPSTEEVEHALRVLQRYLGDDTEATVVGEKVVAVEDEAASRTAHVSAETSATPKSVPIAATAIRGHISEPAGEVYGVVGIVESPGGAGLAAANLAGGADLVLDGSSTGELDLLLDQNSLNLPSASNQTFRMRNTGGGMLNLEVEGVISGIGEGLVGVDAAALGGLLPHMWANKEELATAGAVPVHWDNLADVPPDLVDGDQDTTYTAGPGLHLEGGELSAVWPGTAWGRHISTTLDSAGHVGFSTSITVGADGLALISYYDLSNGHLKVAHCDNVVCSIATINTIDSSGFVGLNPSITIGSDGLGLISYHDETNDNLKVAHCADLPCSSAATFTIDSADDVGQDSSITIGPDGLGLISYYDRQNGDLKVAHCSNVVCSSAAITTIDSAVDVGWKNSITVGSDRLALISYYDYTNGNLKVAHCNDVACTSSSTTIIDSAGDVGSFNSITVGSDGLAMISYYDTTSAGLKVAHCNNVLCSTATTTTIDGAGTVGWDTSITVGSDGLGLISYYRQDTGNLKVAHCNNVTCSQASSTGVDSEGDVGLSSSITIGADGLPLISYHDDTNADLKVVHCSNRFCIPQVRYR
jgi:hypothetical protein